MTHSDWRFRFKELSRAPRRLAKRGIRRFSKLSESYERRFKRITKRTTKISDSVTKADSFLKRLTQVLAFPFNWSWRKVGEPISSAVSANPVAKKIGKIFYPFVALAAFGRSFLQTRSKGLLVSAGVLTLFLVGVVGSLWYFSPRKTQMAQKYSEAFRQAIAKGEFQQANLYQQKLQLLGLRGNQNELQTIENLAREGKLDQAIKLAEQMAPLDKSGSPEAHFWLMRQYLDEKTELKGPAAIARAEAHLNLLKQALVKFNVLTVPANVVMIEALMEFKKGNVDGGLALLNSISKQFWPARILQLEVHLKLNQSERAREDALAISQMIRKEPAILEEIPATFFPLWCDTLLAANERNELKEAIGYWYHAHPTNPQARDKWGAVRLMEIEALLTRGNDEDLKRARNQLVETVNQLGPEYQPMITSWFGSYLQSKSQNSSYLKLAELASQDESASSTLLEILGTMAALRQDHSLAADLLQRALAKDPANLIALNNLAFVINDHFEDRLPLALELAEKAALIQPHNLDVLHTRGMLYLRFQKWDSAIEDLRTVLSKRPNEADVHQGLSVVAYRAIGKAELASFHESLSQ